MKDPAIVLRSAFNLKESDWESVYKFANALAEKLSDGYELPLNVAFKDISCDEYGCVGSPDKKHWLRPSAEVAPEIAPACYVCIHCMEQFRIAKAADGGFFAKEEK